MKFEKFIERLQQQKETMLAVLVDPDKFNPELIRLANTSNVSCFLVGGSVLKNGTVKKVVDAIKIISSIPVVIFPGDEKQLSSNADGLFLPGLLSGRNPEYLIGKQIKMAPLIKKMKLRHVPMAYLLIDGNRTSTTQKITRTMPMNPKKIKEIVHTAMAAEYLGYKLIYLEAGSGAKTEIPIRIVKEVKKKVTLPVIVGGGIDSKNKVKRVRNYRNNDAAN